VAPLLVLLLLILVPTGLAAGQDTGGGATGAATSAESPEARRQPARGVEVPPEIPVPELGVASWALVDLRSGEYLAGEGADERRPMASTAKVVVALAALEMVEEGEVGLDEEFVVSEEAAFFAQQIYSNVGLAVGDSLSLRELLMAAMISSGDDAAHALAEGLGGGDAERFVDRMNAEAREAGLRDTNFENATGLDERGHRTTARDLARATRAAYEHDLFAEIVATPYATITTQDREIYLENTNQLLFTYPKAIGVKTGTTPAAGPSLVSAAREGDESYVAVVLNAANEDRFSASFRALEYGFAAYDRAAVVREGERYAEAPVPFRRDETVRLVAGRDVVGLVGGGREAEWRAEVVEEMPPSVRRGEPLGEVVAYVGGERVGAAPLVAARGYEEASLWERVWYTAEGLFE